MEPGQTIGTLLYFGDPMCSWCWGIKPVLEQIVVEYPELKRVIVMGGLRGGEAVPMNDSLVEMIKQAWKNIEATTGQPFNHQFWELHRPLATTLPACRAVIAARLLDPATEWPFMVGMFQAYYLRSLNPSHRETHLLIATEVGISEREFAEMLNSKSVEETLQSDLLLTQRFSITGFPSLVLKLENRHYLLSNGYQSIENMRGAINEVYLKAGVKFTRPESGIYS